MDHEWYWVWHHWVLTWSLSWLPSPPVRSWMKLDFPARQGRQVSRISFVNRDCYLCQDSLHFQLDLKCHFNVHFYLLTNFKFNLSFNQTGRMWMFSPIQSWLSWSLLYFYIWGPLGRIWRLTFIPILQEHFLFYFRGPISGMWRSAFSLKIPDDQL